MAILLGCIADDLTGATDLGVTLTREGLSVVQVNGVPDEGFALPAVDAVVVALKSRTVPAADAVAQSLAALDWLRARGAERIYFKYCSTFDSTPHGNIGPVTEALQAALGAGLAGLASCCALRCSPLGRPGVLTPATPAYPRNGRTVYLGHLFVGDRLLSESGMREHPLTPMTDANLVRVLAAQTRGTVGLVAYADVESGAAAVRARLAALAAEGHRHAIVDATRDEHLVAAGAACVDLPLSTGGSGLALGLARALAGRARSGAGGWTRPAPGAAVAWLSGSCSEATRSQVAAAQSAATAFQLDPTALAADPRLAAAIAAKAAAALGRQPVLVYATAAPAEVAAAQRLLGTERAARVVEDAFRGVAQALAAAGVRAFVVAGGETSGAVVDALRVRALAIGPEIDPGVPWTLAVGGEPYRLALKSGNFGARDFFAKATEMLQ
ncbi:MAG: four-carbon acid sugar kinase family protein [Betaproteobacteria bacterium]|nr:four-carbon acid sugar kinase family protein [Betaproteobacteria bacterium]